MKLTLGSKRATATTQPASKAKTATAKKEKDKPNRRRSPKELALLWFRAQIVNMHDTIIDPKELEAFADGAKVNGVAAQKASEFLETRIGRVLLPIDKLLEKRGLL